MKFLTPIRNVFNDRGVALILLCLTVLGLYLRLRNLGALGFRWDEDISALAVKGILEHGYPLLPTGMIYLRSGLFLYVLALSASLFEVNEFALRLPAALFSTATILLAYLLGARLFGKAVGLAVAAMISISFWELEMARNVRMYAPFAFFYVLTVFAFYHYYIEGKGSWKLLTVFLACVTITVHQLGFTLGLFFLFPLLFKGYQIEKPRSLLINFAVVSIFFFLWNHVVTYFYKRPIRIHGVSTTALENQEISDPTAFERFTGLIIGVLERFDLPSFELLENLYQAAIPAFVILTLVCLALGAFYLASIRKVMGIDHLFVLLITLFCYLHQFNLALVFFLIYLVVQNRGLLALQQRRVQGLAVVVSITFALWLLYGLFGTEPNQHVLSGDSTHFRQTMRALFDYPRFKTLWGFFIERPVMSTVAALGFLWAFHLSTQKLKQENTLFLVLAFFVPLLAGALFETRYQNFRYVLHLDALYFILVALGLANWHKVTGLIWSRTSINRPPRILAPAFTRRIQTAISGLLLLVVLSVDLNPLKSWLSTERRYYESGSFFNWFDLDYYPDKKTPAIFVKNRLQASDIVIVLDAREQYNYIGRADYWIGSAFYDFQTYLDNGQQRDMYVGTLMITSLQELKRILLENGDKRIWLVASSRMLRRTRTVSADIVNFIQRLDSYVVYVGKDQQTKVYLLGAESALPQ